MADPRVFNLPGIIAHAFKVFREKLNRVCAGPCDGTVLKMHYQGACYFTLLGFMTVFYGWYFGKLIHCISHFKGDENARPDYQNICLSYPYVNGEDGEPRFLLFYRWIHWSLLLLSAIFYIPRKISKSVENAKAKKILEDLALLSPRYDQGEKETMQRATCYIVNNLRTGNNIYFKYLGLNLFTLLIDIGVIKFLDFLFQGRFINLVPEAYPFKRDPVQFKDFLSQTFPPFVSCKVYDVHKILPGRSEEFGCHLTYMELYEKVFIVFWVFLWCLVIVTLLHNIYLLLMLVPPLQKYFIRTSKPIQGDKTVHSIIAKAVANFKVGDVYMLYRMRQHLSPAKFYELLYKLGELELKSKKTQSPTQNVLEPDSKSFYDMNREEYLLRNRHPNDVQMVPPPTNPVFHTQPSAQQHTQPSAAHQHTQPSAAQQHTQSNAQQHTQSNAQQHTQSNAQKHTQSNAQQHAQPPAQQTLKSHILNQLSKDPNSIALMKKYSSLMRGNKPTDRSILME